ncbi:hypothetical protein M0804_006922 [Polistes exclamans]|nr:hypothetical protein M0804_006922 [Polistes exclamans]
MSLRSGFTGSEWCGTGANSLGLPIVLSGMSSISIHGIVLAIAKDNLLDWILDDLFTKRANDCVVLIPLAISSQFQIVVQSFKTI